MGVAKLSFHLLKNTVDGRNPFRTTFEAMGNHLFVGIDRRIIILGLLRWCRISSTHSMLYTPY